MNLWKRLFGGGCNHRFSWPRVGHDGVHYQVCSLCGVAYEYDWEGMRRTKKRFVLPSNFPQDLPVQPITR
ncbi:MAG TPA: hypothetical protein VJQ82_14720 [Terriglobales bacterium]|nr:hypothetical protein [Terriglobales bacterium]